MALVRMKVHERNYWSEVELALDAVEEAGKVMPEKPKHLRLVERED